MFQGYDAERIGIPPEWLIIFIKMHRQNFSDAKYMIGETVEYKNLVCKILAVNVQEEDVVEYALSGVFHLVWEKEIRSLMNDA